MREHLHSFEGAGGYTLLAGYSSDIRPLLLT